MPALRAIGRRGAALALIAAAGLGARADAQSFGFDNPEASGEADIAVAAAPLGARVGGELRFQATSFFEAADDAAQLPLGGTAQGTLDFSASGGSAEASLRLKLSERILSESPASVVDQAGLKVFAGPLALEGGLLKASWGKADSQGPLDALNPLDLTDLTATDQADRKIAVPMLRASLALGSSASLEVAGIFGFEGNRIAFDGPWMPKMVAAKKKAAYDGFYYGAHPTANGGVGDGLYASYYSAAWSAAYSGAYVQAYQTAYATTYATAYAQAMASGSTAGNATASAAVAASAATDAAVNAAVQQGATAATAACAANASAIAAQAAEAADARVASLLDYPDTGTLEWSQGGARLTGSLVGLDLGLQYFYGFLPNPVASADPAVLAANGGKIAVSYNRYHQVGADLAAVVAGFNLRAEAAANLTEDWEGDDPMVYNPHLAWSLGFDRELFGGLSLNVQGSGTYRLFDAGVGDSAYDIEAGTDATRTRITALVSRSFLRDKAKAEVAGVYGVEDGDFLVSPSLTLAVGDASLILSGGYFGGDADGELGQFAESSYARLSLEYAF